MIKNVDEILNAEHDQEFFWFVRVLSAARSPIVLELDAYGEEEITYSFRNARSNFSSKYIQECIDEGAQLIHIPKPVSKGK